MDVLVDRRRSGRVPVEPVLVPLLRRPTDLEFHPDLLEDDSPFRGQAEPAEEGSLIKGVLFGLLLSIPFWMLVALAGVLFFR